MSKFSQDDDGNFHHSDRGELRKDADGTLRDRTFNQVVGKYNSFTNSVTERSWFDIGERSGGSAPATQSGGASGAQGGPGVLSFLFRSAFWKIVGVLGILWLGSGIGGAATSFLLYRLNFPEWAASALVLPIVVVTTIAMDVAINAWFSRTVFTRLVSCLIWVFFAGYLLALPMFALGWRAFELPALIVGGVFGGWIRWMLRSR